MILLNGFMEVPLFGDYSKSSAFPKKRDTESNTIMSPALKVLNIFSHSFR